MKAGNCSVLYVVHRFAEGRKIGRDALFAVTPASRHYDRGGRSAIRRHIPVYLQPLVRIVQAEYFRQHDQIVKWRTPV
jgi:hypothetical protein